MQNTVTYPEFYLGVPVAPQTVFSGGFDWLKLPLPIFVFSGAVACVLRIFLDRSKIFSVQVLEIAAHQR